MKLQELLISLWYDEPNIHEWITDDDSHALVTYKNHKRNIISISLSDLLFSTPFLSLLERKKDINPIWVYYEWTKEKMMCHSVHTEFHKINLVLLSNDVERIEYIENFTL